WRLTRRPDCHKLQDHVRLASGLAARRFPRLRVQAARSTRLPPDARRSGRLRHAAAPSRLRAPPAAHPPGASALVASIPPPPRSPPAPPGGGRARRGPAGRRRSHWTAQPWRMEAGPSSIRLLADARRALPVTDPARVAMMMSLGSALENMLVTMRAYGLRPVV